MPAITFQCGNCKNLMAVEDNLLGQQVRCPHCQQVVVVPESTPSAPPLAEPARAAVSDLPAFSSFPVDFPSMPQASATPHHEEDIFMSPAHASDDLFGGVGLQPKVVMPPEPTDEQTRTTLWASEGVGGGEATADVQNPPGAEVISPPPAETEPLVPPSSDWPEAPLSAPISELPVEAPGGDLTRQAARRAKSESLFTTYLIIFLIPYAIFVTGVAAYFYLRMLDMQQRAPHPLEYLRDSGENPPAKRGSSSVFESISPDPNLPPKLQVALGQSLTIGDLQIQPLKIERRKLTICSENRNLRPQESAHDALVLTLRLRNTSNDVFFTPTDPVFDRQWKEEYGSGRPYTLLEMGGNKFFGGPIQWRPRTNRGAFRAD